MKNVLKKTIEYGLYLFVFTFTLQTRWIIRPGKINDGYSEYLTVSLYGTDILLVFLIVLYVASKFKTAEFTSRDYIGTERQSPLGEILLEQNQKNYKLQITNYKFNVAVFGLFAASLASVFFAQDKILALYKTGVLLLGIGLFWLIVKAEYDKIKLLGWFLAGIGLHAGLAVWQFLTQSGFANKWLGIALHNAAVPGASVVETAGGRWIRAYGGLDHPNILGGLMVVGILTALWLIVRESNILQAFTNCLKTIFQTVCKIRNFSNLALITYYLLLITALFFTFSRAAWAGLVIGATVIAVGLLAQKDFFALKRLGKLLAAGFLLIAILFFIFNSLVFTRVAASGRLEMKSTSERVESLVRAVKLIKRDWLFGVGIGNYISGIRYMETVIESGRNFAATQKNAQEDNPAWHYQPAHNIFLLVWSEIGIFGLLSFAFLLFIIYYLLLKDFKYKKNRIYSLAVFTVIIAMFMADHWWWSLHFGALLFWLILGIIYLFDHSCKKEYNNNYYL